MPNIFIRLSIIEKNIFCHLLILKESLIINFFTDANFLNSIKQVKLKHVFRFVIIFIFFHISIISKYPLKKYITVRHLFFDFSIDDKASNIFFLYNLFYLTVSSKLYLNIDNVFY